MDHNDSKIPRAASNDTSIWTVNGSTHQLAPNALLPISGEEIESGSIFSQIPKKRLESYLKLSIICSLILIVAFGVAMYLVLNFTMMENVCRSNECLRTASSLLQSINQSVDPCDNFFHYACGNWKNEHPGSEPYMYHDWFSDRYFIIKRDIIEFLSQSDSDEDPESVRQARSVYKACNDYESMELFGIEKFWEVLDAIGLPRNPIASKEPAQPWLLSLANTKKLLDLDILISVGITPSMVNSSNNLLAIDSTSDADNLLGWAWETNLFNLEIRKQMENDEGKSRMFQTTLRYATKLISYIIEKNNETVSDVEMEEMISRLFDITSFIYELDSSKNVSTAHLKYIPEEISFQEFQDYIDKSAPSNKSQLQIQRFFEILYEDRPHIHIDFKKDIISVYRKPYYGMLAKYLETLNDKDIEVLIWWNILYNLAFHIDENLSEMKETYKGKMVENFPKATRASVCMNAVVSLMQPAASYYMLKNIDTKKINMVNLMLTNIKAEFTESIMNLHWMDNETKNVTLDKLHSMRTFVGVPQWMHNRTEFDTLYSNLTLEPDTHLDNILQLLGQRIQEKLDALRIINNHSDADFDILDINAYYDQNGNTITVPNGILQFPYIDLGLESLNYGAIGTILGHETTHGFDDVGRQFDKDGNRRPWWSPKTVDMYMNRTVCFKDEYSDFILPGVNRSIYYVDGENTLGENLADDGGIRFSYKAYKSWLRNSGGEDLLPGLESYSNEQLFFLSYANLWCSEIKTGILAEVLEDEHSPNFVRVLVTLQNSPDFSKAWKCPSGSYMNPEKKCALWT